MTLIAAFRCSDTIVLCADSQETYGHRKAPVEKIALLRDVGGYDLAFAGASDCAQLFDGLVDRFRQHLLRSNAATTLTMQKELQAELTRFYDSKEVQRYPCKRQEKLISGVLCVRLTAIHRLFAFHIRETLVLPLGEWVVIGIDQELFIPIVNRLYRPNISIVEAQTLGLHVFAQANRTSTYIGFETAVVLAQPLHIVHLDKREIATQVQGIARIHTAIDDLLLACPDLTVDDEVIEAKLTEFGTLIGKLRQLYRQERASTFRQRVGPIPPAIKREIKRIQRQREAIRGRPVPQGSKRGRKDRPPLQE